MDKKIINFKKGDIILEEGNFGEGFYILDEGVLSVVKDNQVINNISQKGAIFGELSSLLLFKRKTFVRANTDGSATYIKDNLESVVSDNPKFAVKLIRSLGRRLCTMNELVLEGNKRNDILSADLSDYDEVVDNQKVKILVVENKSRIASDLENIFGSQDWITVLAENEIEAFELCQKESFTTIIISSSLPNDSAIKLRRKLKTNAQSLNTPVVGLLVDGDARAFQTFNDAGFLALIFKPVQEFQVLSVLYKLMKLDYSDRYFEEINDILLFKVPSLLCLSLISSMKESYRPRITKTVNNGVSKIIVDVTKLYQVDEDTIDIVGDFAEVIEDMKLDFKVVLVGEGEDVEMWRNLDGCEDWLIKSSVEDALKFLTS